MELADRMLKFSVTKTWTDTELSPSFVGYE